MLEQIPIFSKESIKKMADYVCHHSWVLRYDANDTEEQLEAAEMLDLTKHTLALFADHFFGYYPASYFLNKEQKPAYADFLDDLKTDPEYVLNAAHSLLFMGLEALSTVQYDELNQHRNPRRNDDIENQIHQFYLAIDENIDEVIDRLMQEPQNVDETKPTESQIENLIKSISHIQKYMLEQGEARNNLMQAFEYTKMLELFKNPLLFAWEKFHYGWHSDFWKEGDSMLEYDMFLFNAEKHLAQCLELLNDESPFRHFERNGMITEGLKKVLTDVRNRLKTGEFKIT